MQLDKYQASVLTFLFERLPIGEDVDTLEFSLLGEFSGKYRIAYSEIQSSSPPTYIIFTLPSYSRSVFLALSRTNPGETARLLANLEDYERESAIQLALGEVVVTPDTVRRDSTTPVSVILLRTATSLDCTKVPDREDIDNKQTSFFLVVPLTTNEWEIHSKRGHDQLMDVFMANHKELFF